MTLSLMTSQCAVGVYKNSEEAEGAVGLLKREDIPLDSISIVGGADAAHEAAIGSYSPPEIVEQAVLQQTEREGIWMGGLYGMLVGFATLLVPGIGLLVVLGPLAGLVAGMSGGAVLGDVFGELSFADIASDYRAQLIEGHFLVIVRCTNENELRVRRILESAKSVSHPVDMQTQP